MTTHAKCPECESECIFNGSVAGAIMCPYTHWTGPYRTTEAEAWRAWDTVVGAYWLYRDTINAVGELVDAMEDNDGKKEG